MVNITENREEKMNVSLLLVAKTNEIYHFIVT